MLVGTLITNLTIIFYENARLGQDDLDVSKRFFTGLLGHCGSDILPKKKPNWNSFWNVLSEKQHEAVCTATIVQIKQEYR